MSFYRMRKTTLLIIVASLFVSCTLNEKPEFVGLQNIAFVDSRSNIVMLNADAVFNNPNDLGGTLKTDDLKILLNGKAVAQLTSKAFSVPSKANFTVPLKVEIPIDSIINNSSINSLISSLFSQEVDIQYLGEIDYNVLGYSSSYDVNTTQTLKIKL